MDISLHDKNELKLSMVTRQTAPVLLHHRPTGNQQFALQLFAMCRLGCSEHQRDHIRFFSNI